MEFTLYHRGLLKASSASNKRRAEKHDLRRCFHKQLKTLWSQEPLVSHKDFLESSSTQITKGGQTGARQTVAHMEELALLSEVGGFQFVPTVSAKLYMVADLTITLLRPEPPGQIVTQSGDIDNRLKTLLDALKIPGQPDDLPPTAACDEHAP